MASKMGFLGITLVLFLSLLTNPAQGTSLGYYEPQADMETTDNGYGILDTFSLSFVGNLNFANAIEGVKKIVEGISNFLDLNLIRKTVDILMDVFFPASIQSNEIDSVLTKRNDPDLTSQPLQNNEMLKDGITTVVGAVLDKQQCWEKAACLVGRETRPIAAKDLIFLVAESVAPRWKNTLEVVKAAAREDDSSCEQYRCSTDPPRRNNN